MSDKVAVLRWALLEPWLPTSPNMVKEYLRSKGYRIPKHRTTKKETANEEGLDTLIRQHPNDRVLPLVLLARHLLKAQSYLGDSIIGADDCLHPRYTFLPKTGRLSSKKPNMMNIPQGRKGDVMAEVASAIRSAIIPRLGYELAELDWKAIEALLTGYFAEDPEYMEAAKKGVHDIFASHILRKRGVIDRVYTAGDPELPKFKTWLVANHDSVRAMAKKRVYCLTPDHEVLTAMGWIRMDQIGNQEIAQWETGKISFVRPIWNSFDVVEELIRFSGRGIKLLATKGHRQPWYNTNDSLYVTEVQKISGSSHRIPVAGVHDGLLNFSAREVQLAVACQADGSYNGRQVKFCLKKTRKIERLKALLGDVPYRVSEYPDYADRVHIGVPRASLGRALELLNGNKDFSLPTLLQLPSTLKEVFVDELPYWDGSFKRGGIKVYNNNQRASVEAAQTMAHLCGREALLRPEKSGNLRLHFNNRKHTRIFDVSREHYTGKVYCPTVPSGFFMVRYKDTICVTGNSGSYGQGVINMARDMQCTVAEVKELDEIFAAMAPKIVQWQQATRQRAHSEQQLLNPFGYVQSFFEVFRRENGEWKPGREANEALAFLPQSTCAAMLRVVLVDLGSHPEEGKLFNLLVPTHDSITLEYKIGHRDQVLGMVRDSMERKWDELGGLSVEVEAKWGRSLSDMRKWDG